MDGTFWPPTADEMWEMHFASVKAFKGFSKQWVTGTSNAVDPLLKFLLKEAPEATLKPTSTTVITCLKAVLICMVALGEFPKLTCRETVDTKTISAILRQGLRSFHRLMRCDAMVRGMATFQEFAVFNEEHPSKASIMALKIYVMEQIQRLRDELSIGMVLLAVNHRGLQARPGCSRCWPCPAKRLVVKAGSPAPGCEGREALVLLEVSQSSNV